jgi:hypothetical protein
VEFLGTLEESMFRSDEIRLDHAAAGLNSYNVAVIHPLGGLQHEGTITDAGWTRDQAAAAPPSSIEYVALFSLLDILVSAASLFRQMSSFCESKGCALRRE